MSDGENTETIKNPTPKMGRREAIKLIGGAAVGATLVLAGCEREKEIRSNLQNPVYTVGSNEGLSSIGAKVYPDFFESDDAYVRLLRRANFQNQERNVRLHPGEKLFVPTLRETFGLAQGEEIRPGKTERALGQIRLVAINYDDSRLTFRVEGQPQDLSVPLKEGTVFQTNRKWRVEAVLPGMPDFKEDVPERVVLVDLGPVTK